MQTKIKNKNKLEKLNKSIIKCKKCSRLVKFRKKISREKRKQYINEKYWGKPITGFGDVKGKILFVGLAPAAHGGTRTGRVFTGDRSSDFLYKCLYKVKISNKNTSDNINDGLKLNNAFITTALKCVPPGDKPSLNELNNCSNFFNQEINNLKNFQFFNYILNKNLYFSFIESTSRFTKPPMISWIAITRIAINPTYPSH